MHFVNRPCTGGCIPSHTDLGLCTWGRLTDAKEAHILVTGYSNVAVDNIFLGLRAMGVAALRVRSAGGALVGTNELAAVPGTIQFELSRHQKTHLAASLRSQKKMEQVCDLLYHPVHVHARGLQPRLLRHVASLCLLGASGWFMQAPFPPSDVSSHSCASPPNRPDTTPRRT
jgi:hypothetical protein